VNKWLDTINGKIKFCQVVAFVVVPDILYSPYSRKEGPYKVKAITKDSREYVVNYVNSIDEGKRLIEKILKEVNYESKEDKQECKTSNKSV